MIDCRPATMKDYGQLQDLMVRLQASKAKNYLSSTQEEMEAFLLNSLQYPHMCVLLVSIWEQTVCGIAAMMLVASPAMNRVPVIMDSDRHCFIHAAYIDGSLYGENVPMAVGDLQWLTMKRWALDRGANYIYGNSRLDGRFAGWERRYGLKKTHVVIGTHIAREA